MEILNIIYWIVIALTVASCIPLFFLYDFARSLKGTRSNPVDAWNRLERHFVIRIFKARIFRFVLGRVNPYSRSIDLHITELKHGYAAGVMRDSTSTRNPFKCQHAGALATFGETIGGLAVFSALKPKDRCILTALEAKYVRKARGPITGTASFKRPDDLKPGQNTVPIEIVLKDFLLETVAIINLTWVLESKDQ